MTIPYSNPTNRHEARQNAIYYAEQARSDGTGRDLLQAQVWADIASTFPEDERGQSMAIQLTGDEVVVDDVSEYWRNLVDKGVHRATVPGSGSYGADTTMVVSSMVWDVLRELAMRYTLASMDGQAIIDFTYEEDDRELVLERTNGTAVIVARVAQRTG